MAGRSLRIQMAIYNRGAVASRKLQVRELVYHKGATATTSSDCAELLVTVSLPAGLTYQPGKNPRPKADSAYNTTVTNGVLTWRGPAAKTQKLEAKFTVSVSAATEPIYVMAGAQCLNSAGVPTCTTPTFTAKVRGGIA